MIARSGPTTPIKKQKVLVVDDSPMACQHVVATLSQEPGVEATALTSGISALQMLAASEFSLLICDYEMPTMNGLQLIRAVRSQRNRHDLPILVLTFRDSTRDKAALLRAGANDYVTKPVDSEELLARVRVQLEVLALHQEILNAKMHVLKSQKLSAVGRLAAGVAHEINTPIQYIGDNVRFLRSTVERMNKVVEAQRAVVELARSGGSLEEALARVDSLERETAFARMLKESPAAFEESLDGLGQVAKIVRALSSLSGPRSDERCPVDINECIETAIAVSENLYRSVARLDVRLAPTLTEIMGCRADLNQVFLTLLMNAAQAIEDVVEPGSQGTITITSAETTQYVEVRVTDSGRGIPSDVRAHVFEPFFTTRQFGEGRGQELALARATIVDGHEGTIEFESEEGQGTTFLVRLPLPQMSSAPVRLESAPVPAVSSRLSSG